MRNIGRRQHETAVSCSRGYWRRIGEQHTAAVPVGLVVVTDNHAKLIVEGAPPNLHVVPVLHDTALERVLEDEDTALLLGLLTT